MNLKLIDIHSHVNFPDFDKDQDEVIKRALEAGIGMINVGTDYESSKKVIEIAEQHDGVYATVGFHPNDNKKEEFNIEKYKDLAKHPKVVAIGETGLDYFRIKNSDLRFKNLQTRVFKQQVELALEIDKPLMIHCRDAHDEVLNILNSYFINHKSRLRGNVHFFSGTLEQAQKYLDLGFFLSFTGVITFTDQYNEIIKNIPLDKIMVETDAPFVAPVPYRNQRNETLYVQEVAKKLAEIRGVSYEKIAEITTQNASKLFNFV